MVLIYVITSLCRKCPYKHIFIIISPFVRKNGDDNSLKQKLIKQKSSTAILQYCSFILCSKWVTANSFYEMSPRLIIYYLSYLIFTCKNKKSNKFCDGQKLIIRWIHPPIFRFCKKALVGMFFLITPCQ